MKIPVNNWQLAVGRKKISGIRYPASGIILFLLLQACSPQKRLDRFLIRHPEFRHPDTLSFRDTFFTQSVTADTLLHIDSVRDTVIIEKERLKITLHRVRDTLRIRGQCLPDTLIIEKKIPVEKIRLIQEPFTLKSLKPALWLLITLLLLILILSIVKRI